jgi:hypothetical protein
MGCQAGWPLNACGAHVTNPPWREWAYGDEMVLCTADRYPRGAPQLAEGGRSARYAFSMIIVKLTYFKATTGKYYGSADFGTNYLNTYDVFNEVRRAWVRRELPGLVQGHSPFIVLVETPNHEDPESCLIGALPGSGGLVLD